MKLKSFKIIPNSLPDSTILLDFIPTSNDSAIAFYFDFSDESWESEEKSSPFYLIKSKEIKNIKIDFINIPLEDRIIWHRTSIFKTNTDIGVLTDCNVVYLYENIEKVPRRISIDYSELKINQEKNVCEIKHTGFSDDNVIPFLFKYEHTYGNYISLLTINNENYTAKWGERVQLLAEDFPQQFSDWLEEELFSDLTPIIESIIRVEGYLIACTRGRHLSNKESCEIIKLDSKGRLVETLYSIKLQVGNVSKSKIEDVECKFSHSHKYAILTTQYKNYKWKSKQKLFDLKKRKIINIEMPEGYSDYKIIDHFDNTFWLQEKKYSKQLATDNTNEEPY